MRLDGSFEREERSEARSVSELVDQGYRKLRVELASSLRRQLAESISETRCCECNKMSAIPQGAFAVLQVRKNCELPHAAKFQGEDEEKKDSKNFGFNAKVLQEGRELTPLKYNSKLMNSIWGLYNRYSVHNFKKIDANEPGCLQAWVGAASEAPSRVYGAGAVGAAGH